MADTISKTLIRAPGFVPFGEETAVAHRKRIALTAAQITTLHSTPVSLVPAPGAGFAIVLHWWTLQFIYGTVQFTGGGVVAPVYHGATTDLSVAGGEAAATILAAASDTKFFQAEPAAGGLDVTTNTGIDLYAASADFAGGDGTAVVTISYTVMRLG